MYFKNTCKRCKHRKRLNRPQPFQWVSRSCAENKFKWRKIIKYRQRELRQLYFTNDFSAPLAEPDDVAELPADVAFSCCLMRSFLMNATLALVNSRAFSLIGTMKFKQINKT